MSKEIMKIWESLRSRERQALAGLSFESLIRLHTLLGAACPSWVVPGPQGETHRCLELRRLIVQRLGYRATRLNLIVSECGTVVSWEKKMYFGCLTGTILMFTGGGAKLDEVLV